MALQIVRLFLFNLFFWERPFIECTAALVRFCCHYSIFFGICQVIFESTFLFLWNIDIFIQIWYNFTCESRIAAASNRTRQLCINKRWYGYIPPKIRNFGRNFLCSRKGGVGIMTISDYITLGLLICAIIEVIIDVYTYYSNKKK